MWGAMRIRDALTLPVDPDRLDQVEPALIERLAPWFDRFGKRWFDLEVDGVEHVPGGPALVVGNHNSGTNYVEMLCAMARLYLEHDLQFTGLAHDAVVSAPALGNLLVRVGAVRASHANANAAFSADHKVVVFPGGNLEAFRSYRRRHRIDFGGHKGFVRLALRHRVPIVPMVSIGGHEGFVILTDGRRIARRLGLDRVPILRTDTFPVMLALPWGVGIGPLPHVPWPTRCATRFLEPVPMEGDPDDPDVIDRIYAEVTGIMQAELSAMARSRKG